MRRRGSDGSNALLPRSSRFDSRFCQPVRDRRRGTWLTEIIDALLPSWFPVPPTSLSIFGFCRWL
jgi:hypothetical protein